MVSVTIKTFSKEQAINVAKVDLTDTKYLLSKAAGDSAADEIVVALQNANVYKNPVYFMPSISSLVKIFEDKSGDLYNMWLNSVQQFFAKSPFKFKDNIVRAFTDFLETATLQRIINDVELSKLFGARNGGDLIAEALVKRFATGTNGNDSWFETNYMSKLGTPDFPLQDTYNATSFESAFKTLVKPVELGKVDLKLLGSTYNGAQPFSNALKNFNVYFANKIGASQLYQEFITGSGSTLFNVSFENYKLSADKLFEELLVNNGNDDNTPNALKKEYYANVSDTNISDDIRFPNSVVYETADDFSKNVTTNKSLIFDVMPGLKAQMTELGLPITESNFDVSNIIFRRSTSPDRPSDDTYNLDFELSYKYPISTSESSKIILRPAGRQPITSQHIEPLIDQVRKMYNEDFLPQLSFFDKMPDVRLFDVINNINSSNDIENIINSNTSNLGKGYHAITNDEMASTVYKSELNFTPNYASLNTSSEKVTYQYYIKLSNDPSNSLHYDMKTVILFKLENIINGKITFYEMDFTPSPSKSLKIIPAIEDIGVKISEAYDDDFIIDNNSTNISPWQKSYLNNSNELMTPDDSLYTILLESSDAIKVIQREMKDEIDLYNSTYTKANIKNVKYDLVIDKINGTSYELAGYISDGVRSFKVVSTNIDIAKKIPSRVIPSGSFKRGFGFEDLLDAYIGPSSKIIADGGRIYPVKPSKQVLPPNGSIIDPQKYIVKYNGEEVVLDRAIETAITDAFNYFKTSEEIDGKYIIKDVKENPNTKSIEITMGDSEGKYTISNVKDIGKSRGVEITYKYSYPNYENNKTIVRTVTSNLPLEFIPVSSEEIQGALDTIKNNVDNQFKGKKAEEIKERVNDIFDSLREGSEWKDDVSKDELDATIDKARALIAGLVRSDDIYKILNEVYNNNIPEKILRYLDEQNTTDAIYEILKYRGELSDSRIRELLSNDKLIETLSKLDIQAIKTFILKLLTVVDKTKYIYFGTGAALGTVSIISGFAAIRRMRTNKKITKINSKVTKTKTVVIATAMVSLLSIAGSVGLMLIFFLSQGGF